MGSIEAWTSGTANRTAKAADKHANSHLEDHQVNRSYWVDIEELYRDPLDDIYEQVRFGELEYSPSAVLEAVDPVAFRIGAQENADSAVEDSLMVCLNGTYYRISDIVE